MRRYYRVIALGFLMIFMCSGAVYAQNTDEKININSAAVEELVKLPGIGHSTAKNIIEYRNSNGNFESKEQIMDVKGIGEKTYEKIRDRITL